MSTELHCDICNEEIIRVLACQLIRPKLCKINIFSGKKELNICSKCWDKIDIGNTVHGNGRVGNNNYKEKKK